MQGEADSPGGFEVICAFGWGEFVEDGTDRVPQSLEILC
jgi:hypothetical protein